MEKFTREQCLGLLRGKAEALMRTPKRSDFTEREVMMIKAHLGPWNRALEAAGLKEERSAYHTELQREKRLRAKERKARFKQG